MESTSLANRRAVQKELLKTLNSFRASETLCDVVLMVENRRFSAHRVVLSASSVYFKTMFTSDVGRERDAATVELPLFSSAAMEELLDYLYTAEAVVNESNAEALLFAADYFDLPYLRENCAEFLMAVLNPSNCLSIQSLAERYNHTILNEAATEYIGENLSAIWKSEEYLTLDSTNVKELFRGEQLLIKTQKGEEEVFEGIKSWIKHDPETREQYFDELFSYVRLSALSPNFIAEVVQRERYVTLSHDAQNMATIAINIPDEERDEPRGVTESVMLLSEQGCASCYVPGTETWFDLARLPSFNTIRAVTVCDGFVFAFGWEEDNLTVEKFDPRKNLWIEVLRTLTSRPMATATVGDIVFIIKAHGVVRYKPRDNSWTDVAPMDSIRWGLSVVSLNGLVYAIGGHDCVKELGLNSVERYSPADNQWQYIAPMEEKRCYASATTMDNRIFVVGGTGDCFLPLPNCEIYEPITDEWSLVPAGLCVSRSNAVIGKVKKRVFIFGGTFSNGIVECYDKETENWWIVGKIPSALTFRYGCVTWLPKTLVRSLKGVKLENDQ